MPGINGLINIYRPPISTMAFESTKEMLANEIEEKRAQLYQISHLV